MMHNQKEQHQAAVLHCISLGMSVTEACQYAKVGRTTFYTWKQDPDFQMRIDEAGAKGIEYSLSHIKKDASWQSKAWWLERKNPKRYGRQVFSKLMERYQTELDNAQSIEEYAFIYERALNNGDLSMEEFNTRIQGLKVRNEFISREMLEKLNQLCRDNQNRTTTYHIDRMLSDQEHHHSTATTKAKTFEGSDAA